MKLREEGMQSKGTLLNSPIDGLCRVKFIYDDAISVVFDRNKLGSTADAWKRLVDGKILEWNSNDEVEIV